MPLSRTTAGNLSFVPGVFGAQELKTLLAIMDGLRCTGCSMLLVHSSVEHLSAGNGTYIALLNCDYCGQQFRVSPDLRLV